MSSRPCFCKYEKLYYKFSWCATRPAAAIEIKTVFTYEVSFINTFAVQVFSLTKTSELRREETCATAYGIPGGAVVLSKCHGNRGQQGWKHFKVTVDKRQRISEQNLVSVGVLASKIYRRQ